MLLNGVDGGQETGALKAVPVQFVRRNIRRRHQGYATSEQRFHQTAQQHRIGDIRDEKLIEAEHVGFSFETVRNNFQRIAMPLQRR
ncbi:Uncharacterised protein [Klebsiella pneumoniae]|nr:Uncharacterised protein [Klebsiella pneumoniae]